MHVDLLTVCGQGTLGLVIVIGAVACAAFRFDRIRAGCLGGLLERQSWRPAGLALGLFRKSKYNFYHLMYK
jgi:hypothetical protein